MQVSVFNSKRDRTVFGYTDDHTGRRLPTALAPWLFVSSREMIPGTRIEWFMGSDMVLEAIDLAGYYLVRSSGGLTSSIPTPKD